MMIFAARPQCAELSWGCSDDLERFVDKHGSFQVIIGADVVFWPQAVPLLFETVHSLLSMQVSHYYCT